MRNSSIVALTLLALASAKSALAAQQSGPQPAPQLQALLVCRAITAASERLACYDGRVEALAQATATGALVVVDREDIRRTRRSLFGLSLPRLPFLNDGDGDDSQNTVESTIRSVRTVDYGKWQFTLEDGEVWQTTEPDSRIRTPRAGQKIVIRRGSLGGYYLSVEQSREIAAKRLK